MIKNNIFDLKLIKYLAIFYTVVVLIIVSKNIFFFNYHGEPLPNNFYILFLIDWVAVMAFMSLISLNTRYLISKEISWRKIFLLHFILSIFINLVLRILIESYQIYSGEKTLTDFELKKGFYSFMTTIDINFLIYFAMIFIIYSYYYFNQIKNTEAQKTVLKSKLLSTRLQMLTSQIQPHFLFNTLNAISSLVYSNQDKAQDTIADLSNFLRDVLYNSESNFTTLERELKTLDKYLNILRTRYAEDLKIKKNIDANLISSKVPSLLLQPIIENAIKHGYSPNNVILNILIEIVEKNNFLVFNIENNGKPLQEPTAIFESGIGLSNIEERLRTFYGEENFSFTIVNIENDAGVRCTIKIPLQS